MRYVNTQNSDGQDILVMLQRGVYVESPDTDTVSGFVCRVLGIDHCDFIRDIKTLMLNNSIVDKPVETELRGGDTLVLSGAMPGLVGAMLRSDSPFKSMRERITSGVRNGTTVAADRLVRVKLLNTVLSKYKTQLIEHGFWVDSEV